MTKSKQDAQAMWLDVAKAMFTPAVWRTAPNKPQIAGAVKQLAGQIVLADTEPGPCSLSRARAAQHLDRAAKAATALASALEALKDFAPELLGMAGGPALAPWTSLRSLSTQAREVRAQLVGRGGTDTANMAMGQPTGRLVCALGVAALIERVSGTWPAASDGQAQAACEALWMSTDPRVASESESTDVGKWERHLRSATNARADKSDPRAFGARLAVDRALGRLNQAQKATFTSE